MSFKLRQTMSSASSAHAVTSQGSLRSRGEAPP
jgi:hypothetical protein